MLCITSLWIFEAIWQHAFLERLYTYGSIRLHLEHIRQVTGNLNRLQSLERSLFIAFKGFHNDLRTGVAHPICGSVMAVEVNLKGDEVGTSVNNIELRFFHKKALLLAY